MTLRNTADRASREVVQVYLAPADPDQPVRLVGWAAADVAAGATATSGRTATRRMWRRWDTAGQRLGPHRRRRANSWSPAVSATSGSV